MFDFTLKECPKCLANLIDSYNWSGICPKCMEDLRGLMTLEDIERVMRPKRLSENGFLDEKESLVELLEEDDRVVKEYGLTHKKIVETIIRRLAPDVEKSSKFLETKDERTIKTVSNNGYYSSQGKYFVETTHYKGTQPCPWKDSSTSCDHFITHQETNKKIILSGLALHLIEKHHFYEGKTRRYRVDPKKIIEFFDIQAGK